MRSAHRRPDRTVLYDGGCGLCSGVVRRLRGLDILGRVEFLDATRQWDQIALRYPALSQDACLLDIHIVDGGGQARTGFDAYRSLAWVLPIAWIAVPFLYIPGIPATGQRVYRYVADHRSRDGCEHPPTAA